MSMRHGALGFVFASMLVVLSPPAGAQIVRWTDERGEVHLTEGLDSVPERYRGGAEVLSRSRPPVPDGSAREPTTAGGTPVASGMATVRFQAGRPIMAAVRINGSAVVVLQIDTGADMTVLSPSVMKALGADLQGAPTKPLMGIGGVRFARIVALDRFEVGGAAVAPFQVAVMDVGPPGQGLIGQDFLQHFSISMDSHAGILTLWAR
jgi:predicted aspartyl protease